MWTCDSNTLNLSMVRGVVRWVLCAPLKARNCDSEDRPFQPTGRLRSFSLNFYSSLNIQRYIWGWLMVAFRLTFSCPRRTIPNSYRFSEHSDC